MPLAWDSSQHPLSFLASNSNSSVLAPVLYQTTRLSFSFSMFPFSGAVQYSFSSSPHPLISDPKNRKHSLPLAMAQARETGTSLSFLYSHSNFPASSGPCGRPPVGTCLSSLSLSPGDSTDVYGNLWNLAVTYSPSPFLNTSFQYLEASSP